MRSLCDRKGTDRQCDGQSSTSGSHWIPARSCPCPLDSRTPVSVPDGSPRTHSQGQHARTLAPGLHARSLAGSPCTHAISPHARARCIPCKRIRVRWMHHVCISQLYVLMGRVICSSSSSSSSSTMNTVVI